MNGAVDPSINYVDQLSSALGRSWGTLASARSSADEVREVLIQSLADSFTSADIDVIVFGSLARQEWTSGSDVDWTLLIDGQASPDHRVVARHVGKEISQTTFRGKLLPRPGSEGIFGNMAFAHDIIHHIGGQHDTNRNTTQRILLLLEAWPVRPDCPRNALGPYERVTKSILYRYLHDDTNFAPRDYNGSRIPRFLLNDIVRYWRTMCVDFAYKEWEQGGSKWAIRNVKLRMSRKLLFVAGLLTVFSCYQNDDLNLTGRPPDEYIPLMQEHLMRFVRANPINILIWSLNNLGLTECAGQILDHYDKFLMALDNEVFRARLDNASPAIVYQDSGFLMLRETSHHFQSALDHAFFDADTDLRDFTRRFGVF